MDAIVGWGDGVDPWRGDGRWLTAKLGETEDLSLQLDLERSRREIAERRVDAYQQSVADIVSAEDLDTVLSRIVRSASRAIQAPGFVLEVEAPTGGKHFYAEGITTDAARELIADGRDYLSVEVT